MFTASTEKRLFQLAVLLATIVPIVAGGSGMLLGPRMIAHGVTGPPDLDSHFRYLSGLLFGLGVGFIWSIVRIEQRASVFRVLGLIVVAGGLARLLGMLEDGLPGTSHRLALIMELLVVPLVLLWLGRIERIVLNR